jgi:microcystin-dependent protein
MSSPFVAEIRIFGCNFAPTGWAMCNGQILPISQNTALFSLLGTTYGGNGQSTFALPNLEGAAPVHPGQGPGLSLYDLGQMGGEQTVTLLESEIAAHNHFVQAYTGDPADSRIPKPTESLGAPAPGLLYNPSTSQLATMALQTFSPTGGSLPHNNMMPFLTLNFCIALQGVFPARP